MSLRSLNPRTALAAAAATILLLALGPGPARAQDASGTAAASTADANPVVLRLGSTVERRDAFNARFEIAIRTLAANQGVQITDEIRAQLETLKPRFLEQRATELVLLDRADRLELSVSDDEVDATIERLRGGSDDASFAELLATSGFEGEEQLRELVAETLLVDEVVEDLRASIEIEDGELRTHYVANRARFATPATACARHILLETVEDAEAVLAELDAGADFAELAAERSTGPSGPNGGDLGCFERGRMVAPFANAAFDAEIGTPVGPVETQFGQHVILVYDRSEASVPAFEDVREQVETEVRQAQLQQRITALRTSAGVVTYPERLVVPAPEADPADEGADDTDGDADSDGSDGGN